MKLWLALYVSQASQPFTPTELNALLARAQHHNALAGITGALMHYRGRFMQVIEGDEPAVAQCLTRIGRDVRHHDMKVVYQGPLEARSFGQWTMRAIHAQHDNEPVVEDFWRKLAAGGDSHVMRTAVNLMQRLAQNGGPAV